MEAAAAAARLTMEEKTRVEWSPGDEWLQNKKETCLWERDGISMTP